MLCFLCGKFSFWPSSNSGLASQSWIESAIRTKWLWNALSRSGDIKLEKVQDTMALWYILDPVRLSPLHGALWYFHISPPWLSEFEEKLKKIVAIIISIIIILTFISAIAVIHIILSSSSSNIPLFKAYQETATVAIFLMGSPLAIALSSVLTIIITIIKLALLTWWWGRWCSPDWYLCFLIEWIFVEWKRANFKVSDFNWICRGKWFHFGYAILNPILN